MDGWKARYYQHKLPHDSPDSVAMHYLRGLIWVMRYYYQGCCSWKWFFPYHYAPFPSDLSMCIQNSRVCFVLFLHFFKHNATYIIILFSLEIQDPREFFHFELGEPFAPFEQLMSVLPSASKHALPPVLSELMQCVTCWFILFKWSYFWL